MRCANESCHIWIRFDYRSFPLNFREWTKHLQLTCRTILSKLWGDWHFEQVLAFRVSMIDQFISFHWIYASTYTLLDCGTAFSRKGKHIDCAWWLEHRYFFLLLQSAVPRPSIIQGSMLIEIINFDREAFFLYLSTPRPMQRLSVSFSFACPAPRDATAAAA